MKTPKSKNHHDAYFRQVFSKKEHFIDLLEGILPKLTKNISTESLEIDNTTYLDKKLDREYSDLVYNCLYGKEKLKIALLFEHKSRPEKYIELQLLRYILSVWLNNIKQDQELLPVIPIVFHQSEQKPILNAFDKLKDLPETLKKYLPVFETELFDTSKLTTDKILGLFHSASIKFSLVVMKYIRQNPEKVFDELRKLKNIMKILANKQDGRELIETTTIYISKIPETDMKTIVNNFKKIEKTAGNVAKSAYEKVIEESQRKGIKKGMEQGMEKGMMKGMEKGKIETAMNLLKLGLGIEIIQKATGFTREQIEQLQDE